MADRVLDEAPGELGDAERRRDLERGAQQFDRSALPRGW